ncbi:MAG TPA: PadR family transcriptional regulator [Tepidisphaeraceae bacterium]|jgi:DNA-binding PadR family transcriptional regulator|nr:PadR family transcriptional regulator [Tepidisphaeraceae bacterium]
MDFSQDLVKGSVVPVVLALLRERRMYGYEMVKQVNARTGGKLEWKEGTLYPTLHRLEGDGLIKAEWEEEAGRMRKYYGITGKGRRELERRAEEWKAFSSAVNVLLEGGAQ